MCREVSYRYDPEWARLKVASDVQFEGFLGKSGKRSPSWLCELLDMYKTRDFKDFFKGSTIPLFCSEKNGQV